MHEQTKTQYRVSEPYLFSAFEDEVVVFGQTSHHTHLLSQPAGEILMALQNNTPLPHTDQLDALISGLLDAHLIQNMS